MPWSLFVLGLSTGALLATLAFTQLPPREPDVEHYRMVRNLVERSFAGEVERDELLEDALVGLVGGLDEYSAYYGPVAAGSLDRETRGVYTGLGVVFAQPTSEGRVLFALPGGPADAAGIVPGDRFRSLDGAAVDGMEEGEFIDTLRAGSEDGFSIELESRDGSARELRLSAEELVDPSVRHARLLDERVGHVSILTFTRRTPDELDAALRALGEQGMEALVLDLRANPGGVLSAAVDVANRFVEEGVLVSTRNREGREEAVAVPARAAFAGLPLALLVDEDSASASEVVAGALQDHRAAVVVGTPTYGKGAVQSLARIPDRDAIVKLTTGWYETPAGRRIDRGLRASGRAGIEPDLLVEVAPSARDLVHEYLASIGPPPALAEAVATWEREEGRSFAPTPPRDPQLDAALALLQGRRPGEEQAR
jgi:carboxyl-terminal processing protease